MTRADVLEAMYRYRADDETLAELALQCSELPQPESLDRFVRAARATGSWNAAAGNALLQLFGIDRRSRRL